MRMKTNSYVESKANEILEYTHKVKAYCAELAKLYAEANYSEMISRIREYYGELPSYLYEDYERPVEHYAMKTLLAAMISERIALRLKGYWKHLTIAIVGVGGSGKTTYAILSAIGSLMMWGKTFEEAVRITASYVFFNPKNFVTLVKQLLENRLWVPFIILDDIGSQISKYWIWLGEMYWSYLFSVLDQLKDWCCVLIMTARSNNSIPARMREIIDIVIQASESEVEGLIIDLMRYYRRDDYEKRRTRKPIMIDALPPTLKMPNEIWRAMTEARRELGIKRISRTMEMLELKDKLEEQRIEKLKKRVEKHEQSRKE